MFPTRRANVGWFALALIIAAFVWASWPLLSVASANGRLLVVFYVDEAKHFNMIAAAAARHVLATTMWYGYVFFNLTQAVLLLRPAGSDQQIILTLRIVEWAFSVGTLGFVFFAARRVSMIAAVLTTALLATLPVFLRWSVISHPDMVQLFFIWVALYASARRLDRGDRVWTLVAAAAAGLAFSAKFAGMFLLPIIWAVDVIAEPRVTYREGAVRLARAVYIAAACAALGGAIVLSPEFVATHLTRDGSIEYPRSIQLIQEGRVALLLAAVVGLGVAGIPGVWRRLSSAAAGALPMRLVSSLGVFLAVFALSAPQAWRGLHFVRMMIVDASEGASDQVAGPSWLSLFTGPGLFTLGVIVFAVAGSAWALARIREFRTPRGLEILHTTWIVVFGFAMAISLHGHELPSYYLLPIIPSILFLAARGWEGVWMLSRRWPAWAATVATIVLLGAAAAELWHDAARTEATRREIMNVEVDSRPVQFGNRLHCYLAPPARVLFDYFSYVPPAFADARPTWGGSLPVLRDRNPDAVIVNATVEAFYPPPRGNAGGEESDPYLYYKQLRENRTQYRLVASDGPVRLYVRPGSPYVLNARSCS